MFGLMALANVLMIGLYLFSDLGLRQSIVQSQRGHDPIFLNTVWTVQIIRGGVIWLLALGLSLALYLMNLMHWMHQGSVYAEPVLPYIVAVLSFNFFIGGFESTKLATASRNMALKRYTLIEIASQIAGIVFMLVWAWIDRSIWALALGSLVSGVLKVTLSHTAMPGGNNRLHWDPEAFHEIFHFGKWIFLTSILGFLAMNGDRLMLGDLVDAKTLGMYAIAFFMFGAIQDVISKVMSNVAFPALSEVVRDRPAALKQTYYKFRIPADVVSLLAVGFFFAAGDLIIKMLYDNRYLPASHMLQILSVGLFMVRYGLVGQCFMAMGKPKFMVPIITINMVVLYVLMPIAFAWYGLNGALWVIGAGGIVALPLIFYFKIKYNFFDLARELVFLPLLPLGYALGWLLQRLVRVVGWAI
jgi:O-antigen/teichoic acid export membrane protein